MLGNVDRPLKSPVGHRGRDFAIVLSCLARLVCSVERSVVNGGVRLPAAPQAYALHGMPCPRSHSR